VIIHRKRYDDWTLPKGKLDVGESLPACAVREVREETGVTIRLSVPLDSITYQAGNAGLKKVDYWGGVVLDSVRRAPDAEVDVVSWLPVRAALGRLTYSHDHFLVQQFLEQPSTTPLIILRHAKAMDRKDWSRKDSARPIISRGRRQAKMLIPMLAAYGVTKLVSSTSTRCTATVLPYAHQRELAVETYSLLSEEEGENDPKGVGNVARKIRASALASGESTAICVHRPVLPHILAALDIAPTTLVTGEFLVAHLTADGTAHALERHRPQA
ncbi:MAG TPA: NUDIX domain-containing protein, partial [Propionibacteriaceae bacterium]|nr:NUDIX domain-containing protein [Propionibacteriaceae bacterium]